MTAAGLAGGALDGGTLVGAGSDALGTESAGIRPPSHAPRSRIAPSTSVANPRGRGIVTPYPGRAYDSNTMHGRSVDRRTFLVTLGRGTVAVALVGLAGCASDGSGSPTSGTVSPAASDPPTTTDPIAPTDAVAATSDPDGAGVAWERVDLGFVSAYVLARSGEAAVVDTGGPGSAAAIEASLGALGLGWGAVGHLVLTHRHGDHVGSATEVLDRASDAVVYAGAADIDAIGLARPVTAVADGDRVFDLRIVSTPGHTAGHIAVLDEVGGILVAGDALNTSGGELAGSDPRFTDDADAAAASVAKLGALRFETLLVGHGEPITDGASALVAALAGS